MTMHHLIVKHTVSRARDTYGYNVVTIWEGNSRYRAIGGGYDMLGACFGNWLQNTYYERLKKLKESGEEYYGLSQSRIGPFGVYLDGACGLECMVKIAARIGLEVNTYRTGKKACITSFILHDKEGEGWTIQ